VIVLLCKGSAKVYKTLQQEQETHLYLCKTRIGLTESQRKGIPRVADILREAK
jgi:hypothetical protein